jgi:hypothetical protein
LSIRHPIGTRAEETLKNTQSLTWIKGFWADLARIIPSAQGISWRKFSIRYVFSVANNGLILGMYALFMETSTNTRKTFLKTAGLLAVASATGVLGKVFLGRSSSTASTSRAGSLKAVAAPNAVPRPDNKV